VEILRNLKMKFGEKWILLSVKLMLRTEMAVVCVWLGSDDPEMFRRSKVIS